MFFIWFSGSTEEQVGNAENDLLKEEGLWSQVQA